MAGGIRIRYSADTSAFSAAVRKYADAVTDREGRIAVFKDQMRLLTRGLIDLTPFESLVQGRAVVKKHLNNAMFPFAGKDGDFDWVKDDGLRDRLRGYQRSEDYDSIKHIWSKIGVNSSFQLLDFEIALHHRAQNARGHVDNSQNIMVPQYRAWAAYLDHLRGQVGRARGGWAAAARALGLSLPQWVTRWIAGGTYSVDATPGKVIFTMRNEAIFIPRYGQTVQLALAGREKAMETDVRRWLDKQATYAGFRP